MFTITSSWSDRIILIVITNLLVVQKTQTNFTYKINCWKTFFYHRTIWRQTIQNLLISLSPKFDILISHNFSHYLKCQILSFFPSSKCQVRIVLNYAHNFLRSTFIMKRLTKKKDENLNSYFMPLYIYLINSAWLLHRVIFHKFILCYGVPQKPRTTFYSLRKKQSRRSATRKKDISKTNY